MDRKATAFVEQFSATLFNQWTQQPSDRELFWKNGKFLHQVLEEGVAKLPKVPVKGHLTRELQRFVELLRAQLIEKYAAYQAENADVDADSSSFPLFNEEDVERALATASDDEKAKIASVLALDVVTAAQIKDAINQAKNSSDYLAVVELCVVQLRNLKARRYESTGERDHKTAFYFQQIVRCVDAATHAWCSDSNSKWVCAVDSKTSVEREKLRVQLQSIVASDLLAAASSQSTTEPWTSFFQPQEDPIFRSLDVFKARAGIYGALLSLAVSFPVVADDSDSDSDSTSDDSSSDDDSSSSSRRKSLTGKRGPKRIDHVDCVELAKLVARQIVLAVGARSGSASPADWFIEVLGAFHRIPQPAQWISDDDDDDEDGLDAEQCKALLDVRADLYARAFTSSQSLWQQRQLAPLPLFEALLCLRHAAEFMRVERKQTVAAVTTATSQLVGVALPPVFWKWMTHVKKMYASEHVVVQGVMKKLTKHKSDKKMANVLMQESTVTRSELAVVVEHFALFLEQEKEKGHFVVARGSSISAAAANDLADDETADNDDSALFFVDDQGGKPKKRSANDDAGASRKREKTDP